MHGQVGTQVLALADALGTALLRHRVHGRSRSRTTTSRGFGAEVLPFLAAPGGSALRRRHGARQARRRSCGTILRPDAVSRSGSSRWASAPRPRFYRSYHVMQGIDEIVRSTSMSLAVRPRRRDFLAALMKIQERIKSRANRPESLKARVAWERPATARSTDAQRRAGLGARRCRAGAARAATAGRDRFPGTWAR